MRSIYIRLSDELKKKHPTALATIIDAKGSTPQIPGASALFSPEGLVTGTLGGGSLEADAEGKAIHALKAKKSHLYTVTLNADITEEDHAICGGEASILIDASPEEHQETFQTLRRYLESRSPGVLATFIRRSSQGAISIARHWIGTEPSADSGHEVHKDIFKKEVKKSLENNKPQLLKIQEKLFSPEDEETLLFLEPAYPLPHLVIAGAGHIGQAVAHLGYLLDFEVTVIDDRPEFANRKILPEADTILVEDIGRAIEDIPKAEDTYIVIVTRGHKHDADALKACVASNAAYVGMIGSARKIALMRTKFIDQGWATTEQFDAVYAPIGVDIQSKTVQEIAVSIAAQLVQVRRQKHHKIKESPWSGP